jgi:hypothetical protein
MSDLVHCIYTSVEPAPLPPEEIEALLTHSRNSNSRRGITGILLHVDCTFFQVLEGPREEVDELYAKILVDGRHTRITRIIYEPIARRFFGEFAMNFATLSARDLSAAIEGEDRAGVDTQLASLDEGRAKRLLRAFSEGRWRARFGLHGTERQSAV